APRKRGIQYPRSLGVSKDPRRLLDRPISRAMTVLIFYAASPSPSSPARRSILCAVAALHRLQVDRLGGVEHRGRHADLAGVAADHPHVLLPHRNLHGGVFVVTL